ncbi:FCR1 Fluconazole resistance protein 1 [Candida maltosa Xu316]|uniref:Zn(2)-C6 fungal-type domain-containing protein n=1 Tax=Candida maltosa (strain Xu316) TaxID=1245528 RepID=M3HDX7_CANMX|nr:hypothetical protein G210_4378 [Candida maltosa Xu316]
MEDNSTHHQLKKKRVGKACDSCRIKKTKCDGKKPCNRCILDNKICVFTEKKKPKEKKHPLGYVELLETRLDILSKSFEKLIELSRPHLQFIEDLANQSSNDTSLQSPLTSEEDGHHNHDEESENIVPINKVVCYLINQQGLLKNLPVEWEQGTMIAANYDSKKNLNESSKLFAEHKLENTENSNDNNNNNTSPASSPKSSKKRSITKQQEDEDDGLSPEDSYFPTDGPFVKQEPMSPHFQSSSINNPNDIPQQFSLTGFNTNFNPQDNNISDMDSDSSHRADGNNSPSVSPQMTDYRTSSLFTSNTSEMPVLGKTASLTSLTNKYEKHTLSSPTTTTTPNSIFSGTNAGPILATLRRSSSSLSQKTMSSSQQQQQQKSKNSVHKPSHYHSRVSSFDKRMESSNIVPSSANFTFDTRYDELDDSSQSVGFNNYIAPPLPQPPSPSDSSMVYNSLNHLSNGNGAPTPATMTTTTNAAGSGGLDILVDHAFDPFFNNNNNPFTGKFQMG